MTALAGAEFTRKVDRIFDEANRLDEEVEAAFHSGAQKAVKLGRLLLEAKDMFPHGAWLAVVADKFNGGTRRAQVWMRIAKNCERLRDSGTDLRAMSQRDALKALAVRKDKGANSALPGRAGVIDDDDDGPEEQQGEHDVADVEQRDDEAGEGEHPASQAPPTPGRSSPPPPPLQASATPAAPTSSGALRSVSTTSPRPAAAASAPADVVVDELGKPVPAWLVREFNGRGELVAKARELSVFKKWLTENGERLGGAFFEGQDLNSRLDGIISNLRRETAPYAVCRLCGGRKGGCEACKGHGWMTWGRYHTVPEELRDPEAVEPWRSLVEQHVKLVRDLRDTAARLRTIHDFDPNTGRSTHPYGHFLAHADTVKAIDDVIASLEGGLPARTDPQPPGYVSRAAEQMRTGVRKAS
jgi:hypothetical protein